MKNRKFSNIIAVLLCILTSAVIFTSCDSGIGSGTASPDVNTEGSSDTDVPAETHTLNIITNGNVNYEIVYPRNCDITVSSTVTKLRKEFKRLTGLEISTKNDSGTDDEVTNKIIVGKTKHQEAQKVFGDMKYDDCKVEIAKSNIIVAAFTEEGYENLTEWIIANIFTGVAGSEKEKNLTVEVQNYNQTSTAEYRIKSWTIAGNALSKYRIVYSDSNHYDYLVKFRDAVAENSGYFLDIIRDSKSEPSQYEILVGDTNRAESMDSPNPAYLAYSVSVKNEKLVIKTGGSHSASKFLDTVYNTLAKGKTEISMDPNFTIEGNYLTDTLDSSKPADSNLRIMSCNVLAEFESWTTDKTVHPYLPVGLRKEILFSAIDYYQPTVIGFQEMTAAWYSAMDDYTDADKWELVKFENKQRTDGEYVFTTVMFRKDLYTLVDSGTKHYSKHNNARCRCYTWVVLKDNATGKEFTFASTHWDGAGRENGFLQAGEFAEFVNEMKQRGPVFTTGDFNSNELSAEYKQFLIDADICDAKLNTQKKVNNIGSWHNFCNNDFSWGSCDHITATKDTVIQQYQTITENEVIYGSDHCWIIADIKFN